MYTFYKNQKIRLNINGLGDDKITGFEFNPNYALGIYHLKLRLFSIAECGLNFPFFDLKFEFADERYPP